jgi:hypothetical protein
VPDIPASCVTRQRFHYIYGISNLGKFIGPAGPALIVGASTYVSPTATLAGVRTGHYDENTLDNNAISGPGSLCLKGVWDVGCRGVRDGRRPPKTASYSAAAALDPYRAFGDLRAIPNPAIYGL